MVKQRARRPSPTPPRRRKSAPRSRLPREIGRQIGEKLRTMFDDVLTEPVPERFRKLLEELERKSSKD